MPVLLIVQGMLIGFLTGLVGAGGGFLIVPALVVLTGLGFKTAVGTSLFIIAISSLIRILGRPDELFNGLVIPVNHHHACNIRNSYWKSTYSPDFINTAKKNIRLVYSNRWLRNPYQGTDLHLSYTSIVARTSFAARSPDNKAPLMVPNSPLTSVASPAKKSLSLMGAPRFTRSWLVPPAFKYAEPPFINGSSDQSWIIAIVLSLVSLRTLSVAFPEKMESNSSSNTGIDPLPSAKVQLAFGSTNSNT